MVAFVVEAGVVVLEDREVVVVVVSGAGDVEVVGSAGDGDFKPRNGHYCPLDIEQCPLVKPMDVLDSGIHHLCFEGSCAIDDLRSFRDRRDHKNIVCWKPTQNVNMSCTRFPLF